MKRAVKRKRIGWVVTDQLETMPAWPRIDTGVGGIALSRLHWVVPGINNVASESLHYQVYKPWKRYDGLIFLKAIGQKAHSLAVRYRDQRKPVVFDANINYYNVTGVEHYEGMFPTKIDQDNAITIVADSRFIAKQCDRYNKCVTWIPDSVEMDVVPELRAKESRGRLKLA